MKRLLLLNVKSVQEGLSQVFNYSNPHLKCGGAKKPRKRSLRDFILPCLEDCNVPDVDMRMQKILAGLSVIKECAGRKRSVRKTSKETSKAGESADKTSSDFPYSHGNGKSTTDESADKTSSDLPYSHGNRNNHDECLSEVSGYADSVETAPASREDRKRSESTKFSGTTVEHGEGHTEEVLSNDTKTQCKIFVNNIDFKVSQKELWEFFEHFGRVTNTYIAKDRRTRRSRGFGFVLFASAQEAERALNGKKYELRLNGRLMQVLPALKKKRSKKSLPGADKFETTDLQERDEAAAETTSEKAEKICEKDDDKPSTKGVTISAVCDDLLIEVFSYLDVRSRIRVESVCRRWNSLAVKSWIRVTHLDFKNIFSMNSMQCGLNDRVLISILNKNCANLRSLDLSASPYLITVSGLSKLASVCSRLETINLSQVPLKKDAAKILGKNLTQLRRIEMSGCLNVGEKAFWWLFKDLTCLQELEITNTSRLIGNCIYMLPTTVTRVNFENCSELGDTGLRHLSNRCPDIVDLNLSLCPKLTDIGLFTLFEKCRNVVQLKLKGVGRHVTSTGLASITSLRQLTHLDVSRNLVVTDDLLQQVAVMCRNLVSLNVEACHGNVTDAGIRSLCFSNNLTHLNMSYLKNVTDCCVSELALEGKLETFLLRSCPKLTDRSALVCVKYLEKLVLLDFSGCGETITDDFPRLIDEKVIRSEEVSANKMHIILGGTEVTLDGAQKLQEKLEFVKVTMENYQVGSLRDDRDPTLLVRPFFPESDEEDEDEEDEEERELVQLKPDIELDITENYPRVDEDGEKLWESLPPQEMGFNVETQDNTHTTAEAAEPSYSYNTEQVLVEESWDDELEEGRVWSMPSLPCAGPYNGAFRMGNHEDYDEFLENDSNLSRLELVG